MKIYALLALISPALACCASDFNITSISTTGSMTGMGNTTIKFTVHDPDPVTNAATDCSVTFANNGTAPSNYMLCASHEFQWKIGGDEGRAQGFTNAGQFGFQVRHSYQDDSLGPPPYNRRATYGSMDVNSTNLDCSTSRVGIQTCSVKAGTTLNMPIWGTS